MLPRNARLHKAADFRRVRGKGKQWRSFSFLAFVVGDSSSRLGVIVSAKIGKAVVRKRASRVLREAYRASEADLKGKSIVLIARPMVVGKTSTQVAEELKRMGKMLRVWEIWFWDYWGFTTIFCLPIMESWGDL